MKKYRIILIVACVVSFAFCGMANAETLFLDNFQSDTAGTAATTDDLDPVIGAGDIGISWKFTTPEPAVTDFQVLNNQDVTGTIAGSDNYLKVTNAGGASANVWAELSDASMTTGKSLVQTDFDLYLPANAGEGNFVLCAFETTGYANRGFNVYINQADGSVNYYNGAAFGATGLTVGLDQWVHMTIAADMAAKKFDITVDGTNTFTGADMLVTGGTVGALNVNAKLAYIDNLQVFETAVPEPSTCFLLGMGLLAILAGVRRRR